MSKEGKIKVNVADLLGVKYENKLEDLKNMLLHTKLVVDEIMNDKEAEAPYVSAGQVVGIYWKEVLLRVYGGNWDTYFASKAIEAINKVLPEDLLNNDEFTAGFNAVMSTPNEKEVRVLSDLGYEPKPVDIN